MIERIIKFFISRHLLVNLVTIMIYAGGIFFWFATPKEELPDMELNFVRITVPYQGTPAEDIEHFITKPIEEKIKGVDDIYRVTSASSAGLCSIQIEIEKSVKNMSEVVNDIRSAVSEADLPDDLIDDPNIRQFKTSHKAVVDIALYDKSHTILSDRARRKLQEYALSLESRLLDMGEISSINRRGYLKEEFHIQLHPQKLLHYNIPVDTVYSVIRQNHLYRPAGSLENAHQTRVTLMGKLDTVHAFNRLIVQAGFEGQKVRLSQIADVKKTHEKKEYILKIDGYEGIILNAKKNGSTGILESLDAIHRSVRSFKESSLKGSSVNVKLLDDESQGIRNRVNLISMNGLIGFSLILLILLLFLNFRSSLWVAIGIPFSFCLTMIMASIIGFTINNVTLAAVIIVMGIVVDDAIIVAENISRLKSEGLSPIEASIQGTSYVLLPITASVITTCVAFLPMLSMGGRFAQINTPMPIIITLMLAGSLIESIFILPSHLNFKAPRWARIIFSLGTLLLVERFTGHRNIDAGPVAENNGTRHWFMSIEESYGTILHRLLEKKFLVFGIAGCVLIGIAILFSTQFKFVMFPGEEASEVFVTASVKQGSRLNNTARLAQQVEEIVNPYVGNEVVGYRTLVGQKRWGSSDYEYRFTLRVEVANRESREKSLEQLLAEWRKKGAAVKNVQDIKFLPHRFGHAGGSPIEITIKESDDKKRSEVAKILFEKLKNDPELFNVETDEPVKDQEIKIIPNRERMGRLGISPASVKLTSRTMLDGEILYELTDGDENVNVRLTSSYATKKNLRALLDVPVVNRELYMVPLSSVVSVQHIQSPIAISRIDYKRATVVYADIKKESGISPIEVAEKFEASIFPDIMSRFPSSVVSFTGEVKDTRESSSDFKVAMIMVLLCIYAILAIMFNSLLKPAIIMLTIPFSAAGVILAFWLHDKIMFGFFAMVGTLGLAGVVVNDSIIMLVKLEDKYLMSESSDAVHQQVAAIAKTRLRAVLLTTFTTVGALLPTAYGIAGYDSMLAEMMLAMAWGLLFATFITLVLIPCIYDLMKGIEHRLIESKAPETGDKP